MTRKKTAPPTLRPITPEDAPFLREVYASARLPELAPVPWDDAQKQAFLTFQFNAQHQHYQDYFPGADFHVVLHQGTAVGRLYVDRRPGEIRILDVALLPAHQGRGLGRALLRGLMDEARAAGQPVRIHVEPYQERALRLFEQLGFEREEDQGTSVLMAWTPAA